MNVGSAVREAIAQVEVGFEPLVELLLEVLEGQESNYLVAEWLRLQKTHPAVVDKVLQMLDHDHVRLLPPAGSLLHLQVGEFSLGA